MKKILATLLATTMIGTALVGCSKPATDDTGSTASTDSKKPVTVTVTAWGDFKDTDAETILIKKFNEENKDIQIEFQPIPGDGYGDKLMANFAGGTANDLFLIGEGDYRMYSAQGVTEPLTPYMEKDKDFDIASYNEGLINSATFDGAVHFLPKDFNPIALFYNKDMFDKYKVEYPSDKWTWDDLEAAAKIMTNEETKEYGFFADTWEYATMTYLKSFGVEIGNEDATKAEGFLNSPEAVDLITRYTNYILKDKISPSSSSAENFGGATSMFQTGQIAMMVTGGWNRDPLNKAGTNYGTAMVPMGKEGTRGEIICSASWGMYSKSKVKDEAWTVLKYLTGPEASQSRYDTTNGGLLPAHQTLLDEVKKTDVVSAGLIDSMEYATQTIRQKGVPGQYFGEPYNAAFEEILLTGAEPKAALDKAAKAIDDKIKQETK